MGVLTIESGFNYDEICQKIDNLPAGTSNPDVQGQAAMAAASLEALEKMRREGINASNLKTKVGILNENIQAGLEMNKSMYTEHPTQPDRISQMWQDANAKLSPLHRQFQTPEPQTPKKEPWSKRIVPNFLRKKALAKSATQTTEPTPPSTPSSDPKKRPHQPT